jgi:hypothetical protein
MSQSKVELRGAHGLSALIPCRRNGRDLRFSIGLLLREDPVRCFGQVPGHGADGLLMALASGNALIEATDVAAWRATAVEANGVGGFDEAHLR